MLQSGLKCLGGIIAVVFDVLLVVFPAKSAVVLLSEIAGVPRLPFLQDLVISIFVGLTDFGKPKGRCMLMGPMIPFGRGPARCPKV
jgi:hypothetical protein